MIPIVIYARFSSHSQNEQSIEGQLKVCYDYAERNGYKVIAEYIHRAISGTGAENCPDFQRMITDSAKRQFKYALVYQLDRFARNRYDSTHYKRILKKNGIRMLSARENITKGRERHPFRIHVRGTFRILFQLN
jgi:DNA invertase Pin-like site-specific DNA recombinase